MNNSYGKVGIWTTNGFIIERRQEQTPDNISTHNLEEDLVPPNHNSNGIKGFNSNRNYNEINKTLPQPRFNTLVGVEPKFRRRYYHKVMLALIIFVIVLLIIAIFILGIILDRTTINKICRTKECLRTAASLIYSMDLTADPCDDFYQFACGHWPEQHPRPEFVPSNDWFREVQSKVMRKLRLFLQQNATTNEPKAITKARLMFKSCMNTKQMDEREMTPLWNYLLKFQLPLIPRGLNITINEYKYIEKYKQSFKSTNFDWLKSVVMIKKYLGMDLIIGFDVFADPLNGTIKRIAFGTPEIDTALPFNNDDLYKVLYKVRRKSIYEIEEDDLRGNKLVQNDGNEDEYEGEDEESEISENDEDIHTTNFKIQKSISAYLVYIRNMLNIYLSHMELDFDVTEYEDQATELILQAIQISRKIYQLKESAENSSRNSRNPINDIVYLNIQELQIRTDELIEPNTLPIWENYLKWLMHSIVDDKTASNISSWQIITSHADIKYLQTITEYLIDVPKVHLEFYIWLCAVEELILHTTSEMRMIHAEYLSATLGTENNSPRSLYCTHAVNSLMGMAVSYALADENFMHYKLPNVRQMLQNIQVTFNNLVRSTTWMDESTKQETLRKSLDMKSFIGFPEWLTDKTFLDGYYANLHVNIDTHLENMIGVLSWEMEIMLKHINKTEAIGWATSPSNVNAFHIFQANAITVPIAILQYPFYELGLESLNYGSIGTILGHELTHGFDDSGRMFDKNGNMLQWWSNETILEYINLTECFIQQYNQYHLDDIDEYINGEITLGENIADNGGMREAYYAYKIHVQKNGKELLKLPGLEHYTSDQLFFISFGNLWCESLTPVASHYFLTDSHCPGKIRLKGVLSNSQEFAKAFQCLPGSKMNPKNKKCRIW